MPEAFDPYHLWLGIPPEEQPPNHYRLLGVRLLEGNADVISSAADRQMAHVRSFQTGKHAAESQRVLNDLSAARRCLLSAEKKAAYDQALKAQLARQKAAATPPPAAVAPKPLRVAQAVAPAGPASVPIAPADPLGFDPLAEDNAPRHRKRKRSAQQPALLIGVGAALLVVLGLIWGLAGSGGDQPKPSTERIAATNRAPGDARPDERPATVSDQPVKPRLDQTPRRSTPERDEAPSDDSSSGADPDSGDGEPSQASPHAMPPDEMDYADAAANSRESSDLAPAREAVPDAEALKAATADIHALFKDDFSAAKKREQKTALCEKLLALARDSSAPLERYALLSEAKLLAISAGDPSLAMQSIDALAEQFDLDRLELATEMIERLSERTLAAPARETLVEVVMPLVDQAATSGQFKLARRLAAAGLAAARKGNQSDAAKMLARQSHELAAQEKLAEAADTARRQLEAKPDDANAHLALGKYLCFVAGDWTTGLPHMAHWSDAPLRNAAERELDGATSAADRVQLGDLWWDLAEQGKGADKDLLRARAGHWYEQAIGELKGLSKTKIEKRLAELAATSQVKIDAGSQKSSHRSDPRATGTRTRGKIVFLADLPQHEVRTAQDDGGLPPLSLNGIPAEHAIYLHPPDNGSSHAAYDLDGQFQNLVGRAGMNDDVVGRGKRRGTPLTFRIVGDTRELWRSRPLERAGESQDFRVSVAAVRKLELFVDCPGDFFYAHGVWFDPQLTQGGPAIDLRDSANAKVGAKATVDKESGPSPATTGPRGHENANKKIDDLLRSAVLIASFDDATILHQKGEAYVRDLSDKQKPGLIVGATLVPGKAKQGLSLQKPGEHVDWGADPSLNPPFFTACAWIKPATHEDRFTDILSKHGESRGQSGFVLRVKTDLPELFIGIGDGQWHVLRSTSILPHDQWLHLAVTHDADISSIYQNGRLVVGDPSDGPVIAATERCFIGSTQDSDALQFYGLIDEVALFDRALSADEIQLIYELGKNGRSLTTSGKH